MTGSYNERSRDGEAVEFSLGTNNCAISKEAIADHFGGDPHQDLLETFRFNRLKIEAVALKLIRQGQFESDGSILIRTSDC
jgi:hypothetical protein